MKGQFEGNTSYFSASLDGFACDKNWEGAEEQKHSGVWGRGWEAAALGRVDAEDSKCTSELISVNTELLDDKSCRMGLHNVLDRGENPKEQWAPTRDCRTSSSGPLYCQWDSKSFPHQAKCYMWNESHLLITEQYSPFSGARSCWHSTRPIFQPCCGSHRASPHRFSLLIECVHSLSYLQDLFHDPNSNDGVLPVTI